MNKKYFFPLIIFLAIVVVFFVQLRRNVSGDDPRALESALIGKSVPEKKLMDLFEDKTYDKTLFQQGKPLLVNVWATWCPTCYAEHQYLNELAKQGINIIGINYKDDSKKAIEWLKNLDNPYQVVVKDEKGAFGLDLGVYGAPETFIVNEAGIILYRHTGDVNPQVWREKLQPIYQKVGQRK